MSYGSPYGGTPLRGDPGYYYDVNSPSPTPSPHHYQFFPAQTPQRPATRAHHRGASTGYNDYRPATAFSSPRYKTNGEYGMPVPSPKVSSRKHNFSKGASHQQTHRTPKRERERERRNSHSYFRASHGDSDEDEIFEVDGVTYVLPAQSRSRRHRDRHSYYYTAPEHGTNHYYYPQVVPPYYENERERADYARYEEPPLRPSTRAGHHTHSRRPSGYDDIPPPRSATRMDNHSRPRRPSSGAVPPIQRPSTTRPSSSHQRKAAAASAAAPKATEADAKKHRIPAGYSLKNWDPTEEPIMLLGSVFDSNSLGKWIYDWTVYHHGPATPMADVAGELWLLLIQLSGKVKRSEEVVPTVRAQENREMIEDFIESGERLTDKLRALLKKCESPMLKASKKREAAQLGKNSGIEFVDTLFGVDREMPKTERFMQSVRLWNLRFDANCEDILKRPTQ
ncbi:Uu.00g131390.m01.CDS01 [Anthostomella pinea]|uniref:Uu.00g131390.m01.CDS01 n=1 Tax=Anthostomella pinea TaxID=933095 RepID=A0AAI8YI58_9PEZI|nr:Uu.00g131390.m01.CDS01 [Anthostomella pinea]